MPAEDLYEDWDALQRRCQRDGIASATPAQRLRWLEDAIAFAVRAGALPAKREADPGDRSRR